MSAISLPFWVAYDPSDCRTQPLTGYCLACSSFSSCLLKLEKGLFHDYLNNSSVLNFKATPPENFHSRKRREVQIDVTMEVNGVENEDDFREFQLRHHHLRFRRDAAEQCGPLKCNSKYKYQTYGLWGLCLTDIFLHRLWQSILAGFSRHNRGTFCCGLIVCYLWCLIIISITI